MASQSSDPAAEAAAMEAALAAARTFNITLWTLYAFGVLVTALRTYSRFLQVGFKNFDVDDYLAWVAILLYSLQTTLGYEIGNLAHGMANNGMTDAQRAALSPLDPEWDMRVIGSKIQVAGWTSYSTLMAVLKFAMLFFYLRLTNGLGSKYRLRVHAGFALVAAGYIASVGAVLLSCLPFHKYWQINPNPGMLCQPAISPSVVWASFAANLSTDIYLIVIPLPLLWGSRLRLMEKIGSTLVLGAGIFVLVCATLKTVFVVIDDVNGAELAGAWGTREAFVAVITTNLPMVFPLVKSWLKPIFGSYFSRGTSDNYKTPKDGFETIGGGRVGEDGSRSRGKATKNTRNTRSTNPLTNVTFTESEERIMMDEMKQGNLKIRTNAVVSADKDGHAKCEGHGNGQQTSLAPKGIVVHTEFNVAEDSSSQHHSEISQAQPAKAHEPW
ncbi:hypothetical protein QBC38DRAFT_469286 [Podospora fimiseda]|uniref:Rhodopsin domain-containing protein n=1 Tax=Podospora fimiseda TaxID=252190 RepID=A0AAN7H2P5_9PEZI|nr:hypothetical protein QBC38DRAFT_469286 [Podospora fimiseda]